MNKLYDLITWHNNTTPSINETNLNAMSEAINNIDDRVINIADLIVVVVPQIQQMVDRAEEIIEDCEEYSQDSEAWARGTKNGVPVPSDAEQYQNNAKWYAEHLQTDLGNLNDVEITSPTDGDALVYDDVTGKWKNGEGAADIGLFIDNGILMCRYSA
jgi:hypothetical protein